ncbi:hypothetical protein HC928_19045 [bacterium]|nr:hypothetical protein [bacterium]
MKVISKALLFVAAVVLLGVFIFGPAAGSVTASEMSSAAILLRPSW